MNLGLAGQSGWGKSAKAQEVMEKNAPEYEQMVVLDFKDEYRGLVRAGFTEWWIVGPRERDWTVKQWLQFLAENPKVVLVRHDRIDAEAWREISDRIVAAARRVGDVLIVIDEAHFVAPQRGKTPDAVKGLATTGRGEGASSIWISQRLSELEETVIAQWQARLLGGFESSADLGKVGSIVEYPQRLHNPQAGGISPVPDELHPDDAEGELTPPLRKFEDDEGNTIGSEWIYSDNSGEKRRLDTRGMFEDMESEHFGAQGRKIEV